jgi:predicted DNA-binding ribbon-helix-helix protein
MVATQVSGVPMKSAITKRSVVIGGHKTSVSLEEPFWTAVRNIAVVQQMTVSNLLRQIDLARRNTNLSSAIRVYVLENVRSLQELAPHGSSHQRAKEAWRSELGPA